MGARVRPTVRVPHVDQKNGVSGVGLALGDERAVHVDAPEPHQSRRSAWSSVHQAPLEGECEQSRETPRLGAP